ncbi:MAG: hypothetical protein ACTHM0_13345 [Sphingomonas sp.]
MRLPEKLPEAVWHTFREAVGSDPAVRIQFAPIGPAAVRAARRAVATALGVNPDDVETAGDAMSRELLQRGIIGWEGIGDHEGATTAPTRDTLVRDEDGKIVEIVPGTISLFLSDPAHFEWADQIYVVPWVMRDLEKNGSSASPGGTGQAGTQASGTASSAAKPGRRAAKRARTSKTSRKATKARASGRSSRAAAAS